MDANALSPAQVAEVMAGETLHAVLDVREVGTYSRGHIFRSTSAPLSRLEVVAPSMVTALSTPVIVCAEGDDFAANAVRVLLRMGYQRVHRLAGGLERWRREGRPLVQGVNVPSKVFGEQVLHSHGTPTVTADELAEMVTAGQAVVVVDVRTPQEYASGCVPGAWSTPGVDAARCVRDLAPDPNTKIVVHCGGRTRSYIATETLRRLGLPNQVFGLENGTMGWLLAGRDLQQGAQRHAPAASAGAAVMTHNAAAVIAAEDELRSISPAELESVQGRFGDEDCYVFDVRSEAEYCSGHVPGSLNAPGGQLVQATDEFVAVWGARIVLVCDDGARSTITASWLKRLGLPHVTYLSGGLRSWTESGRKVQEGFDPALPMGYEEARDTVATVGVPDVGEGLLLDVDASWRYAHMHVPGAVWVCRGRLAELVSALEPDRSSPVTLLSHDDHLAFLAGATLTELGYTNVQVLEGGTRAWAAAGKEVESGLSRCADTPDDTIVEPYDESVEAMRAYLRWEETLDADGRSLHSLFVDDN
jgi:rhodanese-related sulfurtransferase